MLHSDDDVTPRLDAAARALACPLAQDLRGLRISALGFKLAVHGQHPIAVAHAVDTEGNEHWLAARSAAHGTRAAYLELFADLLRRGLRATGPLLVDVDGCRWLARRIDHAIGPVVHAGVQRGRSEVAS